MLSGIDSLDILLPVLNLSIGIASCVVSSTYVVDGATHVHAATSRIAAEPPSLMYSFQTRHCCDKSRAVALKPSGVIGIINDAHARSAWYMHATKYMGISRAQRVGHIRFPGIADWRHSPSI